MTDKTILNADEYDDNYIANLLKQNYALITSLEKKNEILKETVGEQKAELETWHMVSNSDDWSDMSEVAKTLDYKLGRNKIFKILRGEGILNTKNHPYQQFVNAGYFKIIEQAVEINDEKTIINKKTVVSQKGIDYIRKVLKRVTGNEDTERQ